mmetsp:Transcript_2875/g.9755  ORF Transcript_2875/g.9755 Transcript_2875/m.9755 type:complete len:296 (-) Transcript_2875:235-1122(-)
MGAAMETVHHIFGTKGASGYGSYPRAAEVLSRPELLRIITSHVAPADLLCWSLAWRATRAAQLAARPGPIVTPVREFSAALPERCAWLREHRDALVPRPKDQTLFCEYAACQACVDGDIACLRNLRDRSLGQQRFAWDCNPGRGQRGFSWSTARTGGRVSERDMCRLAARSGKLEVLQWARENGCPWDADTCAEAALGGHLELLKWARKNGCSWSESTCALAAFGGHLALLKWARDHMCPWSKETCSLAAIGGHLSVLQWAREKGCPWDAKTCSNAAWGGHLEVLKWARLKGCPG